MLKRLCLLTMIFVQVMFSIVNVYAEDYQTISAQGVISNFNTYLENGDKLIYDLIDSDNETLKSEIDKYMGNITISFNSKEAKRIDDYYQISGSISAHGDNWNVSGFNVKYNIIEKNGRYIIKDTTLFDVINPENIFKFVFTILGIVFGSLFIIGLVIILAIVLIKRKKKENYTGEV